MIYKLRYYAKITKQDSGESFTVLPKYIVDVDNTNSIDVNSSSELITGVSQPTVTKITFAKVPQAKDANLYNLLLRSSSWRLNKIEIFCSVDNGLNYRKLFEGQLYTRSEATNTVAFVARGYLDLLNITLIETPVFRDRKVSTFIPEGATEQQKYTLSLAQDPTRLEGSQVGIINAILWLMGGRPYKYRSIYLPNQNPLVNYLPKFYYDCQASVINPEWVWFNYENLFSDLSLLCKAAGGILKQNADGVIVFENVFNIKKTATGVTLTDSDFSELSFEDYTYEPYKELVISYNQRFLSASQEVFSVVFDEYLKNGESLERKIEFEKPVWKLVNKTISGQLTDTIVSSTLKDVKDNFTAVDLFGTKRTIGARVEPHNTLYITKYVASGTAGNFVLTKDTGVNSSQSTTIHLRNNRTNDQASLYIADVKLYGRALDSSPENNYRVQLTTADVTTGFRQLNLGNNPYIQSKQHAERFLDIAAYLMQYGRLKISLRNVPIAKQIAVGDVVRVNSTLNNINEDFRVYLISTSPTLATADYSLISVSGLYTESDLFMVGTSYVATDAKKLAF